MHEPSPKKHGGALFELHGVTKTYGRVTALRDLSVTIPKGPVGLLGPNGAGKTTMIRALLGLINLDSGGGQVFGMDTRTRALDIRQAVGFVLAEALAIIGIGLAFAL